MLRTQLYPLPKLGILCSPHRNWACSMLAYGSVSMLTSAWSWAERERERTLPQGTLLTQDGTCPAPHQRDMPVAVSFCFLVVLGFEVRTLSLQGRHSYFLSYVPSHVYPTALGALALRADSLQGEGWENGTVKCYTAAQQRTQPQWGPKGKASWEGS
jgi:hypothetical protein